jgi:membrane-bound inhibitor of C-type lysozyme
MINFPTVTKEKNMKKIIFILPVLALAACNDEWTHYQCTSEESSIPVKAKFYEGGADIVVNNRSEHKLTQAVAASGARYVSEDGIEFWTKGKSATFTAFGASTECEEK